MLTRVYHFTTSRPLFTTIPSQQNIPNILLRPTTPPVSVHLKLVLNNTHIVFGVQPRPTGILSLSESHHWTRKIATFVCLFDFPMEQLAVLAQLLKLLELFFLPENEANCARRIHFGNVHSFRLVAVVGVEIDLVGGTERFLREMRVQVD